MSSWHSYPSIFNLGHKALTEANFLGSPVLVEEKIDGSQFSFGKFEDEIKFRSKGADIYADNPPKMFNRGVDEVLARADQLTDGWTYRGEYLDKPKHNTLAYDRVPLGHVAIFDINTGEEEYLGYQEKAAEAARLGFDVVPLIHLGIVGTMDQFKAWLEQTSLLGGQKIEGFVLKNYALFGADKKVLMGKHVSEAFKEIHQGEWRKENPTREDIFQTLIARYRTPARWNKAIQHIRERGTLTNSPQDIGVLLKEIAEDIKKEEGEEIREEVFRYAWDQIKRGVVAGFPEYYKNLLLVSSLEQTEKESH